MSWFTKKKPEETEEIISKKKEKRINEGIRRAAYLNDQLINYQNSLILWRNNRIMVFDSVGYNEEDDEVNYKFYMTTTQKGRINIITDDGYNYNIDHIKKARERFQKIKADLKHFGFEVTKIEK